MTDQDIKKPLKTIKVNKPRKKLPIKYLLIALVLIPILGGGLYLLYKGYKVTKDIGFQFSPTQIFEKKKDPELKKDSTGVYTNVLLVGIDTREKSKLLNTDTIIVGSYNHKTKDIVMISIPRDFNAQVNPDKYWFNKINSAYSLNEQKEEGQGLEVLADIVEGITGMEIQYYAMVDLKGFVDLIDAVGGIYVNVENSFTDYMYPLGTGYQTVKFTAGPQLMDGDTALKYARSRKSMQNGEGSDFARARRQQKVLAALKDTLLSSDTLLDPTKLMSILSSIQNNVKVSEFTLDEVQAGITLLKTMKDETSTSSSPYSFVLDPAAGNSTLISVSNTNGYSIGPIAGLGKYDDIQEYVNLLLNNPPLYSENPSIYVYDIGLGYQNTYEKTKELRDTYKYLNIKFLGTKYSDKEGIYIFSNKLDEFSYALDDLASYIDTSNRIKPEYITTNLNGEDISILFGKTTTPEVVTQQNTN